MSMEDDVKGDPDLEERLVEYRKSQAEWNLMKLSVSQMTTVDTSVGYMQEIIRKFAFIKAAGIGENLGFTSEDWQKMITSVYIKATNAQTKTVRV